MDMLAMLKIHFQQTLGQQHCAGSAFAFRNASVNRIKILLWGGNGVWLCQRRLHLGHLFGRNRVSAVFPSHKRSRSG